MALADTITVPLFGVFLQNLHTEEYLLLNHFQICFPKNSRYTFFSRYEHATAVAVVERAQASPPDACRNDYCTVVFLLQFCIAFIPSNLFSV